MAIYTVALDAFLKSNIKRESDSRGIRGAEITYTKEFTPEKFWRRDTAADLVLDSLGLCPGEFEVERGMVCVDKSGVRSERVSISMIRRD